MFSLRHRSLSGQPNVAVGVKNGSDALKLECRFPLCPQLLTYRCGAANRRFGPLTEVGRNVRHVPFRAL